MDGTTRRNISYFDIRAIVVRVLSIWWALWLFFAESDWHDVIRSCKHVCSVCRLLITHKSSYWGCWWRVLYLRLFSKWTPAQFGYQELLMDALMELFKCNDGSGLKFCWVKQFKANFADDWRQTQMLTDYRSNTTFSLTVSEDGLETFGMKPLQSLPIFTEICRRVSHSDVCNTWYYSSYNQR